MPQEHDIAPDLFERLQKTFQENVNGNTDLQRIREMIVNGTAAPASSQGYAARLGMTLKSTMDSVLGSDVLPEGKMFYNIAKKTIDPLLREAHAEAATVAAMEIRNKNRKAGLGIRALRPDPDEDRLKGILDKATSADLYDDVKDEISTAAQTFTQHAADETVERNAIFQANAGLAPKIIRSGGATCCSWCQGLEGVYEYPGGVPKEVYQRHANCTCTIEFEPSRGRRQNVHTKDWRTV